MSRTPNKFRIDRDYLVMKSLVESKMGKEGYTLIGESHENIYKRFLLFKNNKRDHEISVTLEYNHRFQKFQLPQIGIPKQNEDFS